MDTDLDNTALFDIGNAVSNEKDKGLDDYHLPDETLLTISTDIFKLYLNLIKMKNMNLKSRFKVVTDTKWAEFRNQQPQTAMDPISKILSYI